MKIRRANNDDAGQIRQLFYDTITVINSRDYNPEQIAVWSAGAANAAGWTKHIAEQYFFVAETDNKIVGFSSLTGAGYLDFMYIHKDFQGQGIATALLKAIEELAGTLHLTEIWSDVSITARPFFAAKGFKVSKMYTKKIADIEFENTVMIKLIQI